MQTYTWLAQCFLDKGVPEVAIRWYEKALTLPSLDQETRTALHALPRQGDLWHAAAVLEITDVEAIDCDETISDRDVQHAKLSSRHSTAGNCLIGVRVDF